MWAAEGKYPRVLSFDVEVAVAGAGPAGTVAAYVLARAGRDVLLVDSRDFPRDKVCGDLLGADAVATLARLGLPAATLAGAVPLAGAVLHGPRGTSAGAFGAARPERPDDARVLPRRILDARLLASARDAGAGFRRGRVASVLRARDGRVIGLRTSTGDIRARVTIGAEGWGSPVARALGRGTPAPGYAAVTVRAYAEHVADLDRRMHFYINPADDGYAWIFPLSERRANIGLGFITGEGGAANVRAAFERFLGADSPARALLAGSATSIPAAWPIPLGWQTARVATPGALVAGDAARLASPLSGSGIHHALASGQGAARYALRALAGDETAWLGYAAWLRARFAVRLRIERAVHRFAGSPARVEPWLAIARAVPGAGPALSRALLALG